MKINFEESASFFLIWLLPFLLASYSRLFLVSTLSLLGSSLVSSVCWWVVTETEPWTEPPKVSFGRED